MNKYKVINKVSGDIVFNYQATAPIEWGGYEFDKFEHLPEPVESVTDTSSGPVEWLIDIGPFFDRFGSAKMAVLTNQNVMVRAIIQDVQVRKWIDLKRSDVADAISFIASVVPSLTSTIKEHILTTPVSAEENLALRLTYFKDAT